MSSVELLLLSGGIDSACLAFWRRPKHAITIDYGQVCAKAERDASSHFCQLFGIKHHTVRLDTGMLGSGDLAGQPPHELAPESEWWPFRNQLLLTVAAITAVSLRVDKLLLGTVSSDSFHADGRVDFVSAVDRLLQLQEGNLQIEAPAIAMDSATLVKECRIPFSHLGWAHSCHTNDLACGHCRGCNKHRDVMERLGVFEHG